MKDSTTQILRRDTIDINALTKSINILLAVGFVMTVVSCGLATREEIPKPPLFTSPPKPSAVLGWFASVSVLIGAVGLVATVIRGWLTAGANIEADLRRAVAFIIVIISAGILNWVGEHLLSVSLGLVAGGLLFVGVWTIVHHRRINKNDSPSLERNAT